jgi:hypothetical protein
MTLDFKSIANTKLADLERPALPPVGTYLWLITKVPSIETLKGDDWDVVDFQLKAVAPTEDVDADALTAYGDVSKIMQRHRFMFNKNDKAEFTKGVDRLRRFCEDTVGSATSEMSLTEALNSTVNGQILGTIIWKSDKNDAEIFHANIGRTAPAA